MGADLLLAYLPAAKITRKRRRILHTLIDSLSDRRIESEEPISLADDRDVRQMLHEHVDLLPDIAGKYRDALELHLPHMPYPAMFTGGHSWGDSPSEFFDPFCCLGSLPTIYRQLRTWAVADEKSRKTGGIRRRKSA